MDAAEPQPDAPQFKFRWYQYSLRTLLVSVAVFCFMLGMNTRPHSPRGIGYVYGYLPANIPGFWVRGHDYGWPWAYKTKGDFLDVFDHFYWLGLTGDVAAGVGMLVAVNVALEAALRAASRRRSK